MKLKQQPDDFIVVEENRVDWAEGGRFGVYRLTKTGQNTLDVVARVAGELGVRRGAISYSGLKDRHARTEQIITVLNGPKAALAGDGWKLEYLGRAAEPVRPATLEKNRFTIVLRDIRADEIPGVRDSLARIARIGVPNAFDDQRFGSARHGQGFFARAAIEEDWEEALRLAMACPAKEDSARDKRIRQAIRDLWGNWNRILNELPQCWERGVCAWLADHPKDFEGAVNRIERNLVGLMLVAYQSWIWNETIAVLLRDTCRDVEELPYSRGVHVFPMSLTSEEDLILRDLDFAMPCNRAEFASEDEKRRLEAILAREKLPLERFQVRLQKHSFRSFRRKVLLRPEGLGHGAFDPDPLNPGRFFVRLNFALQRGSFATILIKAIQRRGAPGAEEEDE